MAQISNITLPDGSAYNLKGSVYAVIGTQTAATGSWTGNLSTLDALYDGLTIAYYLPYAGSGNATLNLTLKNGTTGAKNVYYQTNTRLTTHYPAGSIIWLTYFSAGSISVAGSATTDDRWFAHASYDTNSNTYDRRLHNDNILAATAITAGRIICGTASGYKNIGASIAFDISYPLLYASAAIAANAKAKSTYEAIPGVAFSNNGTITSGAENKMLYLVGTLSGTTFTIASSGFLTTVPPSSADGKAYIPLGIMTTATTGFFSPNKDVYMYINGSFRPLGDASKDAIVGITRSGTTFTMTKADGTTSTFTQQDNNTTYTANTGIKLNGTTFQHTNAVTAGTAGTSSTTSGSSLAVPYVTYDAQGHITGSGTHTHTVSGFLTSSSSLDATKLTGTIPTANLPSYVDDVLEYTAKANFPTTGETGKIYVDTTTNLTYRWGGSAYVEISPSLAIGTTASTAAKGNHTHSVTAAGSVSQPTFTGTAATISVSKSYTPAGSVAAPTFTGTKASGLTVSPASSGTATYTPAGTVSQPTFTGTAATISVSKSYTPAGSVSTPTISVKTAGSTTTVNSITAVGTLPSLTVTNQTVVTGTSVSNEVLSFNTTTNGSASGWSAGTLPTKGANTTVKTGDAAYESSQPTFTGTAATITSTGSYTPAGTVSQPTFTGTGKRLVLQDYTPAGTNSAPAFTGTAATITSTGSYTPAGIVSTPTFTGSAVTTGTPA